LRSAVVSSFDHRILRWLADQRPTWPRWLNAHDLSPTTIERALELGCAAISVEWHGIDAEALARAREAGVGFAAWTVRDEATYRRLEDLGAIAICAESVALDGRGTS
jgi:glycerophosphoryl diester phosphodiesterase